MLMVLGVKEAGAGVSAGGGGGGGGGAGRHFCEQTLDSARLELSGKESLSLSCGYSRSEARNDHELHYLEMEGPHAGETQARG